MSLAGYHQCDYWTVFPSRSLGGESVSLPIQVVGRFQFRGVPGYQLRVVLNFLRLLSVLAHGPPFAISKAGIGKQSLSHFTSFLSFLVWPLTLLNSSSTLRVQMIRLDLLGQLKKMPLF